MLGIIASDQVVGVSSWLILPERSVSPCARGRLVNIQLAPLAWSEGWSYWSTRKETALGTNTAKSAEKLSR